MQQENDQLAKIVAQHVQARAATNHKLSQMDAINAELKYTRIALQQAEVQMSLAVDVLPPQNWRGLSCESNTEVSVRSAVSRLEPADRNHHLAFAMSPSPPPTEHEVSCNTSPSRDTDIPQLHTYAHTHNTHNTHYRIEEEKEISCITEDEDEDREALDDILVVHLMRQLKAERQRLVLDMRARFQFELSGANRALRRICAAQDWSVDSFVALMQRIQMLFFDAKWMNNHRDLCGDGCSNGISDFLSVRKSTNAERLMARNVARFESAYGSSFRFVFDFCVVLVEYLDLESGGLVRRCDQKQMEQLLLGAVLKNLVSMISGGLCTRIHREMTKRERVSSAFDTNAFMNLLCLLLMRHPTPKARHQQNLERLNQILECSRNAKIKKHIRQYFVRVSGMSSPGSKQMSKPGSLWSYIYQCDSTLF